jgi:isopenicillin N synthase-like dioxygenase
VNIPITVNPIPYHRLLDQNFKQNFDDYLKLCLRYSGYAVIKLPSDIVQTIDHHKQFWNNFFDRELKKRMLCSLDKNTYGGYGGYYNEKHRHMFQISPILPRKSPPWIENEPEFEDTALELFYLLESIAKTCLTSIARSIGINPQLFLQVCEKDFQPRLLGTAVRVCKYKKKKKNTGSLCYEHTDTTILSIGVISDVPELQFYDKRKKSWISVEEGLDESHAVVFIGRILARMTAGYFQPAYHRVFRCQNDERLSFPFFLRPRDDALFQIDDIIRSSNLKNWKVPSSVAPTETLYTHPDMWR